jgi:hypothetical protein
MTAPYKAIERVQMTVYRWRSSERYTQTDIELLASIDEAHETPSGPATPRILEREHHLFGKPEYSLLATISIAHLYNQRQHTRYRERLLNDTRTRPTQSRLANGASHSRKVSLLSARGYSASGRSSGCQRGLPHQCCRRSCAMGGHGFNAMHLRGLSETSAEKYFAPIPLLNQGLS